MSPRRFAERHALITGAGSGLGRAAALALAQEGAHLTLVGRNESALHHTARQARARHQHTTIIVAPADVSNEASVQRAFDLATRNAPVDLLVTSAGVNHPGPLAQTPLHALREMLDTNVLGTLLVCRAFARAARHDPHPRAIVCVSSQMGSVGYPGRAPYCASKHAVNGLTKALALEWASDHIRVNAIAPTFVETPLTTPMLADPAFQAEVISRIPLRRLATVDEIATAILYLLSDQASLITGHVLAIDGGWTAI